MRLSRRVLTGVILTLTLPIPGCAGNSGQPGASPDLSHRPGLEAALEEMIDAWNRDDLAGHVALYAESATFTAPAGLLRGRSSLRDMLQRGYGTPDGLAGTLRFTDREYRMLGPNHAMVTAAFMVENVRDGQDVEGRFTLIFERTARGWEIIHDHSG